ncbi:hypothetical protein [Aeromonas media]|uniref:hypothetical protein n=1 Tax=Aeromonas media TaxID=651 RepID=UPI00148AF858|nr:hypothetical protein [Aeromonas media]
MQKMDIAKYQSKTAVVIFIRFFPLFDFIGEFPDRWRNNWLISCSLVATEKT